MGKTFGSIALFLFLSIGGLALLKKPSHKQPVIVAQENIDLAQLKNVVKPSVAYVKDPLDKDSVVIEHDPEARGIQDLFSFDKESPIVETVTYTSKTLWKPNRAAWLVDYARHYKTSLEFIYRSLRGGLDSSPVTVAEGSRFRVLRRDVPFHFHLVVSLSSCRARLYYVLPQEQRVVFLSGYSVCLGKKDESKVSGCLTPLGTYILGDRVGVFRPHMKGSYKGEQIEWMSVFGSYWIPFEKEVGSCSEPAKGFGLHGTPIVRNASSGELEEQCDSIGTFASEGCIRFASKDMQELFSVISTRTSYVEIVPHFEQSSLLRGEIVQGAE